MGEEFEVAPPLSRHGLARLLLSEAVGTYFLVLCGTGAVISNELPPGALGVGGIAATFGLVVLGLIYALGEVSGAHFNPAVTLAFWLAGRLPGRSVLPYAAAQLLGATGASATLRAILGANNSLGVTHATIGNGAAVLLEALLTLLLVLVILRVSSGAREKGISAGLAVGAVVGLEALWAGPLTGASMNPARSLGPALVAADWAGAWIYVLGPLLGALAAVGLARLLAGRRES